MFKEIHLSCGIVFQCQKTVLFIRHNYKENGIKFFITAGGCFLVRAVAGFGSLLGTLFGKSFGNPVGEFLARLLGFFV